MFFRFELVQDEGLEGCGGGGGGELAVSDFLLGEGSAKGAGGGRGVGAGGGNLDVAEHVIFDGREGYGAELV